GGCVRTGSGRATFSLTQRSPSSSVPALLNGIRAVHKSRGMMCPERFGREFSRVVDGRHRPNKPLEPAKIPDQQIRQRPTREFGFGRWVSPVVGKLSENEDRL